jgi:hypothetical protein
MRKVQNGIKLLQYSESYSYDDVVSGKNANIGTPKDNTNIHRL